MGAHFPHFHESCFPKARHAGAAYKISVRFLAAHFTGQHGLLVRLIKGFTDDGRVPDAGCKVFRGDAGRDGFIGKERIDLHEESFEGVRFFDAHVLHKIGLAVEVCPVHVIKIDKAQMAYPDAGKTHGDIGAKATETADGDKASVQFFLDLFPMALAKGAINGACHWIRCIPRGENCRFFSRRLIL